jgi:hypothetical protein
MRQRVHASLLGALAALSLASPAAAGTFEVGNGSSLDLGTGSLALGCADLNVLGGMTAGTVGFSQARDVTIGPAGSLNGSSATLELSGDWDNMGSFVAGTSTVRMVDGCGLLSSVVNGDSAFHDLEIVTEAGKQLTFTAGSTQTVAGAFSATGAAGNLLEIRSSVGGSAAFLNAGGGASASYVDVEDNNALGGGNIPLDANSLKGPNSLGWLLTPAIPLLPPLAIALLGGALLLVARRRLIAS